MRMAAGLMIVSQYPLHLMAYRFRFCQRNEGQVTLSIGRSEQSIALSRTNSLVVHGRFMEMPMALMMLSPNATWIHSLMLVPYTFTNPWKR